MTRTNRKKMLALLGLLALLVGGCLLALFLRISAPAVKSLNRDEIFDQLTQTGWCNQNDSPLSQLERVLRPLTRSFFPARGFPPTSMHYAFLKDGTYEWSHQSDVPEGEGAGLWNFELVGQNNGIVVLDNGEVWAFSLNPKTRKLVLAGMDLNACGLLPNQPGGYSAATLPAVVKGADFFQTLTANAWVKLNDANSFHLPVKVQFNQDGTYLAEFVGGCSYEGHWSLHMTEITEEVPEEDCDFRTEGPQRLGYSVSFEGETMLWGSDVYAAEGHDTSVGILLIGRYSSGPGARLYYDQSTHTITQIELTNIDSQPVTFNSISFTQQEYERTGRGFEVAGDEIALGAINLNGVTLLAGQSVQIKAQIIFAGDPVSNLTVIMEGLMGNAQPFQVREAFIFQSQ